MGMTGRDDRDELDQLEVGGAGGPAPDRHKAGHVQNFWQFGVGHFSDTQARCPGSFLDTLGVSTYTLTEEL